MNSLKATASVLALASVLWILSWKTTEYLQTMEGRLKPTASTASPLPSSETPPTPDEIESWRALGRTMIQRMQSTSPSNEEERRELVLDGIDSFRRVLSAQPEDKEALLALGDLSFDQRLFKEAAGFYQRYLVLDPNDIHYRARYASALTFIGQVGTAVQELETVLKSNPNDFHALAYLAIAYAQQGQQVAARTVGERALSHAPSKEARARFNSFLEGLDQIRTSNEPVAPTGKTTETPPTPNVAPAGTSFEQALRAHPIAGNRVDEVQRKDTTIVILFQNFPMKQMPPFARDKFLQSVRSYPGLEGVQKIQFVDRATGEVMEELAL